MTVVVIVLAVWVAILTVAVEYHAEKARYKMAPTLNDAFGPGMLQGNQAIKLEQQIARAKEAADEQRRASARELQWEMEAKLNAAVQPAELSSEPEIERRLKEIHSALAEYWDLSHALFDRLAPVLTCPPNNGSDKPAPGPSQCRLGDQLANIREELYVNNELMRSALLALQL